MANNQEIQLLRRWAVATQGMPWDKVVDQWVRGCLNEASVWVHNRRPRMTTAELLVEVQELPIDVEQQEG